MEKLQELVEVKMEIRDDLPYREALVPQVEDLGLERFVLVYVFMELGVDKFAIIPGVAFGQAFHLRLSVGAYHGPAFIIYPVFFDVKFHFSSIGK